MSTLKTLLSERRPTDAPTDAKSATTVAPSPSLLVFKWDNRSWVLPWSYFLGARHELSKSDEQLTLSFTLCEVIVTGKNLDLLLPDIAAYRLESLRELPEKYHEGSAPSIRTIAVVPVSKTGELEHRPDAGITASGV
jgi:hypothetical protein